MMKFVSILVEGQTEETFVQTALAPHLLQSNIYINPIVVQTKRTEQGQKFKGGVSTYKKIRRDIIPLLFDSSVAVVTTMLDFYGLPNDFPGNINVPKGNPYQRVGFLEHAFLDDINHPRFIPYLALHEFETFIFVEPQVVGTLFSDPTIIQNLDDVRRQYASPEEINDGQATHPAARIKSIIPTYSKRLHGPLFVEQIGIAAIRTACPHFNQWLTRLESLGS